MSSEQVYCFSSILSITPAMESGTAETDYPLSRINDKLVDETFRTTNKSSVVIKFDMGTATSLSFIALINHNLTGGTLKVKAKSTDAYASATEITGGLITVPDSPTLHKTCFKLWTPVSYRYWWLEFTTATATENYFEIAEIVLGLYTEFSCGFGPVFESQVIKCNEQKMTSGRVGIVQNGGQERTLSINFESPDSTTKEQIELLNITAKGAYNSFVLVYNYNKTNAALTAQANRNAYYGYILGGKIDYDHDSDPIYKNIKFQFVERSFGDL